MTGSGTPDPDPATGSPAADDPANAVSDFDPRWLALREPADHASRSTELAAELAALLAAAPRTAGPGTDRAELVIRDLGCGTGSLARWLAPQLPGPQCWVLHDRDPRLLELAAQRTAGLTAADGSPVRVRTEVTDLTALTAADLAGAAAITASALLDLFTAAEIDALVAAVAAAGCPVLWTLSVTGGATLAPPVPLDGAVTAAFDTHQRRPAPGGALLGPDAPAAAEAALRRHGMVVRAADTPWLLTAAPGPHPGPDGDTPLDPRSGLLADWLRGRHDAAVEQEPALAAEAAGWLDDRLADVAAGRLSAVVPHRDLLAAPGPDRARPSEVAR